MFITGMGGLALRRSALVLVLLLFVVGCAAAPATSAPSASTAPEPSATGGGASATAAAAIAERAAEAQALPESVGGPEADILSQVDDEEEEPIQEAAANADTLYSCTAEGDARTTGDEGPADLTVANKTSATYRLFELDAEGGRVHRADVPAGETVTQSTYESHPWLIATADDRCLAIATAPAQLTIDPTEPAPSGGPLFGPTPTAAPSDAAADEILEASLLTEAEVPAGLTEAGTRSLTDSDAAYAGNGGQGILARTWQFAGTGAVAKLLDLRALFADSESAAAYLEARGDVLSERAAGLQPVTDVPAIGDNSQVFRGQTESATGTFDHWIFLFTTGPLVAKVYIGAPVGLDPAVAVGVAEAAAARASTAVGGDGDEGFPSAAETELLSHVPAGIAPSCRRAGATPETAQAAVACTLGGDVSPVVYVQFASKSDMDAYFEAGAAEAAAQTTGESCQSGPSRTTWSIQGTQYGHVVCYEMEGQAFVEWTDDRTNIDSFAWHAETDWASLYEFWANEAGPNP